MAWLSRLTGRSEGELARAAAERPPGASAVLVTPWLAGARAPWWREEARAVVAGLSTEHELGDVARAAFEAVAWELTRCLEVGERSRQTPVASLGLAGSGATVAVWRHILSGVTGRSVEQRRSADASLVGAAVLTGVALGARVSSGSESEDRLALASGGRGDLDRIDPVVERYQAPEDVREAYQRLRPWVDEVTTAALDLPPVPGGRPGPSG